MGIADGGGAMASLGRSSDREMLLDAIEREFVNPSASNRRIYRIIMEALWPPGTELPGPWLTNTELRAAVNAGRQRAGYSGNYQDPFRRVRELQGEEGLLGLQKVGLRYRLEHVEVSAKRVPRSATSDRDWQSILARSDGACATCGRRDGDGVTSLVPDHKVPRVRLNDVGLDHIDGDAVENLQALCVSCNTFKSVACRGCQENCLECPWAVPETVPVVTVRGGNLLWLAEFASESGLRPQVALDRLIDGARRSAQGDEQDIRPSPDS